MSPAAPCAHCGEPTTSDLGVMLYSPLCPDCQSDLLLDEDQQEPEDDDQ